MQKSKELAIVYPNLEYGGVYSLALHIVYNIVNNTKEWNCTKHFLDNNNLKNKDLIGFTFQYELDYYNFLKILKQNNIPLDKNRKEIIFAGGPCINLSTKLFVDNIDFFILGECEEILPKILKSYNKNKKVFFKKLSKIRGVYIPKINKQELYFINNLDQATYPLLQEFPKKLSKKFVFGRCFILEIERGCPFSCKFCPMSSIYHKTRFRSFKKIKEIIDKGIKINKVNRVVIYSPSFIHPKRKEILKYLISKNLEFSIPSLKVEFVDDELLNLIKKGGQKTLTIAPECNENLRFKIGKNVSDQKIFNFVELANKNNFKNLKLYFIIGLPGQTEKDLEETIEFINKIKLKFNGRIYISINPFIPKFKTKFSDHKFDKKILKKQVAYFKKNLKIKNKISSINSAYKIWKLSRI